MIRTYILLLVSVILFSRSAMAQASLGRWQWAQQMGGVNNYSNGQNEQVNDICTDREGNVYAVGKVYRNPEFDHQFFVTSSSLGQSDVFVSKYDKCGHLKWVRFGGGTAQDEAYEVIVDDSLNVYVTGLCTSGTNQFPDSLQSITTTSQGFFWNKYDSTGTLKWSHFARVYGTKYYGPTLHFKPNGDLSTQLSLRNTGLFYPGFGVTISHTCNASFDFDRNGIIRCKRLCICERTCRPYGYGY